MLHTETVLVTWTCLYSDRGPPTSNVIRVSTPACKTPKPVYLSLYLGGTPIVSLIKGLGNVRQVSGEGGVSVGRWCLERGQRYQKGKGLPIYNLSICIGKV